MESVARLTIVLEVVLRVVQIHAVLLQERMYLRPRVVSKQSPQLGGRELPSTVCLEGKCFQRCTGQVLALCRQVSGNVFGEINGDPHTAMLRASELRCQSHVSGGCARTVAAAGATFHR
jgi:hypothetical protein